MLVVMVLLLLQLWMRVVLLKVRVDRSGRAATRPSSVDNVLRRAFVDHVRLVAVGNAVVVLLSQMWRERRN